MTETIRSLWNGSLCPIQCFGVENREMKELEHLLQRNREELMKTLNETEKGWLVNYSE